jgi:phospholipid/cholesterol/gamma-HCH transport system substrate-binding protein
MAGQGKLQAESRKLSPEMKVGGLFILAIVFVIGFVWYLGVVNPFASAYDVRVGYNYAGGVEVGSPVRVMGLKVGKVKAIEFAPDQKTGS